MKMYTVVFWMVDDEHPQVDRSNDILRVFPSRQQANVFVFETFQEEFIGSSSDDSDDSSDGDLSDSSDDSSLSSDKSPSDESSDNCYLDVYPDRGSFGKWHFKITEHEIQFE